MAEITFRALAERLGTTKQTIWNYANELDPDGEHINKTEKTFIIDSYLAGIIADRLVAKKLYGTSLSDFGVQEGASAEERTPITRDEASGYAALVKRLQADLEYEREMNDSLRADIKALRMEIRQLRAYITELLAAHWWNKGKVIKQWNDRLLSDTPK